MEDGIAADVQLGFVTFWISTGNRYEACVCSKEKEEMIGHGPLDQLLGYLPNIKVQVDEKSCDSFKLELPDDVDDKTWFTKATLTRFLRIISSPESLNKSIAISKEMSQLEEARKFHLSLYSKTEDGIMSDNSKNELLRAMDSRLAALTEELVSTFTEAAGATSSYQEMTDLQNFFEHFGDEDMRNLLSKLSKTSQKSPSAVPPDNKKSSGPWMSNDEHVNKTSDNVQSSALSNYVKPVIYNASSAKAAEIERQSSTESENSSFSSEDDQPSVERSRTLIRSASPRRSASPMRRVQIGRSGPRRTPAITIKNITCFPARERISLHRDTEETEESNKKTEVNVTRMSVQDAISLFERKQKDQTSDTQKKSTVDSSGNANKSVLRRWSAGMGESQKFLTQNMSENTTSENNSDVADKDALKNEVVKSDMNLTFENLEAHETVRVVDIKTDTIGKTESFPNEDDFSVSQTEKINEKMDSVEWSRQKEAELSQMLMKFAEYKNAEPDSGKMRNTSLKQRHSYGPQKEKKDGTLRDENGGKKAQSEFRAKQKVLDQPKPEKSSKKVIDAGKKLSTNRSSAVNKNSPAPLSAKKESPKPAVPKRVPSKSTPLPATRKSWPSTPSPRATGTLPAKIPTGTVSGTVASRQKPQSAALSQKPQSPAPLSRATPKLERPQLQQKDVKKAQDETTKRIKRVDDGKNNSVLPKSERIMKTKPKTDLRTEKDAVTSPAKVAVRKGTKKSSVVPLEAKPCTTHKGAGTNPTRNNPSVQKIEIHTKVEETSIKCEDPIMSHENVDSTNSDMAYQSEDIPLSGTQNGDIGEEREPEVEKPKDGSEERIFDETGAQVEEIAGRMPESPAELEPTEESIISPSAWEESSQQDLPIPGDNSDAPSPVNHDVVASPEPRVRHSLSQMLLEESSEADIIEWGNAENPPTMVYQKDAPKGLKRLLKFARKNKTDVNGTAWSSPYTSEGEDDGDEAKSLGKRHSDNLLRKVALHSKNYGEGFLSDSETLSARSNASNSSARSSNKFHEGHTTSKGTRFFSLSAFRSNKS